MIYPNNADNFILHAEVQSKDDHEMIFRMLEYHAALLRKYKMLVVQLVLYFGSGKSKMKNTYQDGKNYFSFDLICIQDFSYRTFLETDKPEELILAILADFEDLSEMEIADLIFERAKVITNETFGMEKFVNQIEVISKLRNLDGFIQQYIENYMALELKIEDTFTYKKGKKEGKLEGKLEGEIVGENRKRDKMILAMLKKKKYSVAEIAEIAEVSVDYVKELAEQLK